MSECPCIYMRFECLNNQGKWMFWTLVATCCDCKVWAMENTGTQRCEVCDSLVDDQKCFQNDFYCLELKLACG
jgi:hypothetical protein